MLQLTQTELDQLDIARARSKEAYATQLDTIFRKYAEQIAQYRHGPCTCDKSPNSYGPDETCPHHGRTYPDLLHQCNTTINDYQLTLNEYKNTVNNLEAQLAQTQAALTAAQETATSEPSQDASEPTITP